MQGRFVAELLLDFERLRQGHHRQEERTGIFHPQHNEHDVRREEEQGVQDVGRRFTYQDGQRDDAYLFVGFRIACVVTVQDGFRVQSQWYRVVDGHPFHVPRLGHVGKQHRNRTEDDQNQHVPQGDVLQSDATGVQETGRQPTKVDQRQMFQLGGREVNQEDESKASGAVQESS